jgi:hypothetical protein
VAVALTTLVGLTACTNAPKSLPAAGATPRQVLDAYLLALQAGDCTTANAYAVDRFLADGELCGRVNVLAYRTDAYRVQPGPDEVVLAETLTIKDGGQSLPDGDHEWFYTLRRQPSGAWRLSAAGSGP